MQDAENILKYKELTIEIQGMQNIKTKVTTGATGNHLEVIQKIHENTEKAQNKTPTDNSHIGHCTHTSKSTDVMAKNKFTMGNNITCTTHCNYRTAATKNTLETLLAFGYIIANTLHKGDSK